LILRLAERNLGLHLVVKLGDYFWLNIIVRPAQWLLLSLDEGDYETSKFKHKKLEAKHGKKGIRLLRLRSRPIFRKSLITCDLIHTSVDFAPHYTAISHTWRSPKSYEHIVIDSRLYPVSPNIYSIFKKERSKQHKEVF
jgi:hypothetical protein